MRGRVDRSRGIPFAPVAVTTPNLIQQDIGLQVSRLLQIKERSPSPTLGDQVIPVLVVDQLVNSAYPPHRVGFFGGLGASDIANRAWVGVNCRGQAPFPNSRESDKLAVTEIVITDISGGNRFVLEVGRAAGVNGLVPGFASYADTSTKQGPATALTDFFAGLSGQSADAPDAAAQMLGQTQIGGVLVIRGPFVIGVGEGVFVHTLNVGIADFVAWFRCEEYPGP